MKRKRSERGFAHYLFLASALIVSIICLSGWYVYKHHTKQTGLDDSNFVPNAISVGFKDAVTYQQASQLINSYGLSIDHPDAAESDFIPKSYRGIKIEKFANVQNKLRAYPEVKSVIDDSSDPSNNRAGPGEKWIEVIWQENVSFERIKQIQSATGYGLSSQPQGITRTLYIHAPTGKENYYVSKLKHESIVGSANRIGKPVLLDCTGGPC